MNQYEKRAKEILNRRKGVKEPVPTYYPQNTTPVKQMEAMAKKILARKGETFPVVEKTTVSANFVENMTKKELKAELDQLGIIYPKKATNIQLIELLLGA